MDERSELEELVRRFRRRETEWEFQAARAIDSAEQRNASGRCVSWADAADDLEYVLERFELEDD